MAAESWPRKNLALRLKKGTVGSKVWQGLSDSGPKSPPRRVQRYMQRIGNVAPWLAASVERIACRRGQSYLVGRQAVAHWLLEAFKYILVCHASFAELSK